MTVSLAMGAGTPAGTVISNSATGDYKDINSNQKPQVVSNSVTTTVTQVAGVDFLPLNAASNLIANGADIYTVSLTNTGNGPDVFDLTALTSGSETGIYTIDIYHDINQNGIIDGLDSIISVTPTLAADELIDFVILVTDVTIDTQIGPAPDGDVSIVTFEATSQFDTGVVNSATMTTTVAAAVVTIVMTPDITDPQPGDVITYAICGENTGTATAYAVTITAPIPLNTTYVPGSLFLDVTSLTDAADLIDGGDFGFTAADSVTIIWGDAPEFATGCVYYSVVVDADVPVGTEITNEAFVDYVNPDTVAYPTIRANGPGASAFVSQSYDVVVVPDQASFHDPGDEATYQFSISNTGNGTDNFNISYTSTFWTWAFYWDFDGDGIVDAEDVLLTDSNTDGVIDVGNMVQGQVDYIIGVTTIPDATGDGVSDVMTMTATSIGDPNTTPISASAIATTTITAPTLSLAKTVTPTGDQPPGTTLTYRLDIINSGSGSAIDVIITDAIPTNTTFVAGSLTEAGISQSDAADGDAGSFSGTAAVFHIPSLGPGGTTYVIFQATIN